MGETQENLAGGKQRSRWTTLATIGLLMVALGPTLMLGSGLIWGLDISDDLGFFGIVIAVALVGALLVLFFGWWAKVIGLLIALAGAGSLFWTAFGLQQPASFFDFAPGLLVIPGALIAAVSCIAAIVAGRRGRRGRETTGGERTAIRVVLTLVVLAMLASGVLTYTGRQTVADASDATQTVQARDFEFDPVEFEVDGGDTILIQNDDPFFHTFTIDEVLPVDFDRRQHAGDGSRSQNGLDERPLEKPPFFCLFDRRGDALKRNLQVFEARSRQHIFEKDAQCPIGMQMRSGSDQVGCTGKDRSAKDPLGVDAEPLLPQTLDRSQTWVGRDGGPVHRSNGCADDQSRRDPALKERFQHAHLGCPVVTSSTEHEGDRLAG